VEFEQFLKEIDFLPNPPDGNLVFGRKMYFNQIECLRFINRKDNKLIYIKTQRQEGISSIINIYLIWLALKNPGFNITNILNSLMSSNYEFKNIINIIQRNDTFFQTYFNNQKVKKSQNYLSTSYLLPNNSRLNCDSQSKIVRGNRFNCIVFNDVGLNDLENIIDYYLPSLNIDGQIIIISHLDKPKYLDVFTNYCYNGTIQTRHVLFEKQLKRINGKI
jgi:hypothetical protein